MTLFRLTGRLFAFSLLILPVSLFADVHMPALFGDHMVLQQDLKIPVWGTADSGEAVSATLGTETEKTTAGTDGKWRIDFKPLPTNSDPLTLTVTGKNTLKFQDVLIGDVWVCSGQSNMLFDLRNAHNAATEIPKADDPQLRLFFVPAVAALSPNTDVKGQWVVCSPATVARFSAVGYFFGRELRDNLKRPIGLIESAMGGMPAQAFTSLSGLQKDPPFTKYIDDYNKVVAAYPQAKDAYPAALAAYQSSLAEWKAKVGPTYDPILKQFMADMAKAQAAGLPIPPKPLPSEPMPIAPVPPEGPPHTPTVLFNGMIAPLIPYGIKGVIWYQGEANTGNALEYQTLFPRMISDWREKWNQGDFPFLYVQLANFMKPQVLPSEGGWANIREAQLKTLSLPNTGMAVIVDIGDTNNIHPKDKIDVGHRLALVARHVAYKQDLVYSGPLYESMNVEGNKIRLTFSNIGSGLQMEAPPWTPTGVPVPPPTKLTGFAIAGADKKWVWADAETDGKTVVVSSDQVSQPVAVRYAWGSDPACNLYNKEGLPASPFRTDDWTDSKPVSPAPSVPAPQKP